jgi:hypothetical protein
MSHRGYRFFLLATEDTEVTEFFLLVTKAVLLSIICGRSSYPVLPHFVSPGIILYFLYILVFSVSSVSSVAKNKKTSVSSVAKKQ